MSTTTICVISWLKCGCGVNSPLYLEMHGDSTLSLLHDVGIHIVDFKPVAALKLQLVGGGGIYERSMALLHLQSVPESQCA